MKRPGFLQVTGPNLFLGRRIGIVPPAVPSGAAWSPLALTSVKFWCDATQLGLSNGDPVASFTDLSGNGKHFVQGTPSARPTYNTSGINGLPSVEGDGVDDTMTLTAIGSTPQWSAFIVLKQTAVSTAEECYWCIADITAAAYKVIQKGSGADGAAGINCEFNPPAGGTFANYSAGTVVALLVTADGTTTRRVGSDGTNGTASNNNARGNEQMRIFARNDGLNAPLMIGEIVFTGAVLTTEEEAELWAYSSAKWGHAVP